MFCVSSHDNTLFKSLGRKGLLKHFWGFIEISLRPKDTASLPRGSSSDVFERASLLWPFQEDLRAGLTERAVYSPLGPGRCCLDCQPSSRCMQPCSPALRQTSFLTSRVRCQTQLIFVDDYPLFSSRPVFWYALSFDSWKLILMTYMCVFVSVLSKWRKVSACMRVCCEYLTKKAFRQISYIRASAKSRTERNITVFHVSKYCHSKRRQKEFSQLFVFGHDWMKTAPA